MPATIFPAFRTRDAARFAEFLVAAGLTEVLTVPGQRPGDVAHAEYTFGTSGGIMFGSTRGGDDQLEGTIGRQSIYVVLERDADVDAHHDRLKVHPGVEITRALNNPDYGGREYGLTDPDGNQWSFGSYAGAAAS